MSEEETQEQEVQESEDQETDEDSQEEQESEDKQEESEDSEEEVKLSKEEYGRLKREAKKAKRKEPSQKNTLEDEDPEITQRLQRLEQSEQKRQFGHENGLSPEETDKIFQINPNPTKETLDDPFVKAGLQALRNKQRVAENTPQSSKKTPTRKKEFQKLNKQEKNAEWQKHMREKGVISD